MRSSATGFAGGCAKSYGCHRPERMRAGHDYVLIGRRAALRVPFERMAQDFEGALRRVHAGREAVSG